MASYPDTTNTSRQSLMATIAFFDLFNYPLTEAELWHLTSWKQNASRKEVRDCLAHCLADKSLESQQAFYFLPGREELVAIRHERYNVTAEKFVYAMRAARLFRWLPWIKFIAVGNLIGGHNLRRESDIDLLIVTAKGRLWASRLLVTTITKFLGWRPQENDSQDKICLSFWASEDGLDFSNLKLDNDPYFRYWLAGIYPIYDTAGIYGRLVEANTWLKQELPQWSPKQPVRWRRIAVAEYALGKVWDIVFGWTEGIAKALQLKVMSPDLKRLMNQDTRVVVNDQVLKFHANDRREEYRRKFESKLDELAASNA